MINMVFDMETNDPDDFLTPLLLAGHRMLNLCAVTILPGTPAQVGLVRRACSAKAMESVEDTLVIGLELL